MLKVTLMESWGYTVSSVLSSATQEVFDFWLSKSSVLYVSEQVPITDLVHLKLAQAHMGIVLEKASLAPGFGISIGSGSVANTGTLSLWDNGHYISLGLPSNPIVVFEPSLLNPVTTYLVSNRGGKVLAANPAFGNNPALVAYETDSKLHAPLLVAKGRRVVFGWGMPNLDASQLTSTGKTLMRRSIEWCINSPPPKRRHLKETRADSGVAITLLTAILKSSFQGASGPVMFGKEFEKGRNSDTITVGIFNISPLPTNFGTGKRSYEALLIGVKEVGTTWHNIPNTTLVYRDGTTTPSQVFRHVENSNYITPSVRVIGLVLMCISMLLALVEAGLLIWLYRDPVVQRAQPIFMLLLCSGSIITSATIFTLSFDEGSGWTNQQLSVACSLAPWLFFSGQILMFSVLFTKLYRLDRVLRWMNVTLTSAFWPLSALVTVTLSILAAHTIYDPWSWVRVTIAEIPVETYGECTSTHHLVFFGMLTGIIFLSELMTLVIAWKTADVPGDFRDSPAIMYSCFVQIQGMCMCFLEHSI